MILLPLWHFEHFKTFVSYETMQQAASVLHLFEGESTDGMNPNMSKLATLLSERTGHPKWLPDRETGNLVIDREGSVFRNKARLFSSFYICIPLDLLERQGKQKQIILTSFGRALAEGYVSKDEYYDFIIKRFQYPHYAYASNEELENPEYKVRPFIIVLKTLVDLFEKHDAAQSFLTIEEIYHFLQPITSEDQDVSGDIVKFRETGGKLDEQDYRKVREMLAFLAMSQYVYINSLYNPERYYINLLAVHPWEKTVFYLERSSGGAGTGQKKLKHSKLTQIKALWEE